MVSVYMFEKIRLLKSQGKSKSAIARELGLDWKTVDKYLKSNTPPCYKAREKSTREDPLKDFEARALLLFDTMPDLSVREIYEYVWADGYRGSERTLHRRLEKVKGEKPKERFFQQEYLPGEQSQFDFKEKLLLPFFEGEILTYLHFGTLPHSGTVRVRAYPSTNFECYMDGIHHFFEGLGGMTQNIRIDNLSACVAKVLKSDERIWTLAFKRSIQYYGFKVLPCNPGKGNEKGDVERDIRTLARRIKNQIQIQNMKFKNWDHLNEWLRDFCLEFQSEESIKLMVEEKKHLQILAGKDEEVLSRCELVTASPHGTVRIMKSVYSVPDKIIGEQVRVVPGPYVVQIYRGKDLIATHPRKTEMENSILLEHILPSLVRKPRAMIRWAHRNILFPNHVFLSFYEKLKSLDDSSCEREFLKCINLVHYCSLFDIQAGMELIMEHFSENYFEKLRELLLDGRRPNNVILLRQKPLIPELSQYDLFIPSTPKKEIS